MLASKKRQTLASLGGIANPLFLSLWLFAFPAVGAKEQPYISHQEKDYIRDHIAAEELGLKQQKIPAQELVMRGGLPHFFAKAQAGEPLAVAYFGGSITAHNGWRPLSFQGLQEMFPESEMTMVNAAVGGTGSIVGVFRADDDLLPSDPDLVFIEFAVNDGGDALRRTQDVVRALEGIILKLRQQNPNVGICFVYTMTANNEEVIREGFAQPAVSVHEQVASWYDLPSIYVGPAVVEAIDSGDAIFTAEVVDKNSGRDAEGRLVITEDRTHPVIPTGHAFYAGIVERSLEKLAKIPAVDRRPDPDPIFGESWEKARTVPAEGNALFEGDWQKLTADDGPRGFRFGARIYDWFPYLYQTEEPGASVTVRFVGTMVGIKGSFGPDSGIVKIQVDEESETEKNGFSVYNTRTFYGGSALPELEGGEHTVTWTLSEESPDKGKILASYYKPDNDRDFRENPEKYESNRFSVGQIILIGEIIPPR
ncbi:MAG: SGNH/GDSL hydrolase family protein [Verrucomicrobiota bacterium]